MALPAVLLQFFDLRIVGFRHALYHIVEAGSHDGTGDNAASCCQDHGKNGGQYLFAHGLPGLLNLPGLYRRLGLGLVVVFLPGFVLHFVGRIRVGGLFASGSVMGISTGGGFLLGVPLRYVGAFFRGVVILNIVKGIHKAFLLVYFWISS